MLTALAGFNGKVYYCSMTGKTFDKDGEFVVGEEKVLLYVLALLFFALFVYGIVDAIRRHFVNIDYQSYVFALAIIPAVMSIRRARMKRAFLRINKTGIYDGQQLAAAWGEILKVYLGQKEKTGIINIQDNFQLIIEYKRNGKGFRKRIALGNTQNKSEEEVLEAVNFYWMQYKASAANKQTGKTN